MADLFLKLKFWIKFSIICSLLACRRTEGCTDHNSPNFNPEANKDDGSCTYFTPITLEPPTLLKSYLDPIEIPEDNQMSVEGIELGRRLFYDPILSENGNMACVSCHEQNKAFSTNFNTPSNVHGNPITRNVMPLFNLAYQAKFAWDGRAVSLEEKVVESLENPFGMQGGSDLVLNKLKKSGLYSVQFRNIFGKDAVNKTNIAKALAQFIRSIFSGNSKFDRYLLNQGNLTAQELSGFNLFMSEDGADCFHCHGNNFNPLWTDKSFHDIGLDQNYSDLGFAYLTGLQIDYGKFKTPTLRNLIFTAPYMHDGRFNTIDEVIDHYSTGLHASPNIDPLLKYFPQGGVQLTPQEKSDLKAFLLTLTDSTLINNPKFASPF